MAQAVEHLTNKCKTLNSNPSTTKNKKIILQLRKKSHTMTKALKKLIERNFNFT
jgi:DNA-binding MarR family transcriptional regulator